ncbi:chloramphenicol phosphotransferase [Streptomyces albidoflavus]
MPASEPGPREARGRIVLLNGTSSAGKSSIAGELVRLLDAPWFVMSADAFHTMRSARDGAGPAGGRTQAYVEGVSPGGRRDGGAGGPPLPNRPGDRPAPSRVHAHGDDDVGGDSGDRSPQECARGSRRSSAGPQRCRPPSRMRAGGSAAGMGEQGP